MICGLINTLRWIFRSERGGSMMEFAFIAPIMLIISGATIDIGRFIRINQITSVMSQNTANIIYRKCIDQTLYEYSTNLGTTVVNGMETETKNKITTCITTEINKAQTILNGSSGNGVLPGALIMAIGYRFSGASISPASCSTFTAPMEIKVTPSQEAINLSRSYAQVGSGSAPAAYSQLQAKVDAQGVWANGINVGNALNACTKNRLVIVEVTYPFSPIVSFLPNFVPGFNLNSDGVFRETTIL